MKEKIFIWITLATLFPVSAVAMPILDQANLDPASNLFQGVGHYTASPGNPVVAQSFTVGIGGTLAGVDVLIRNQFAGTRTGTNLIAEIFSTAGGVPAGPALAGTTIFEDLIPADYSFFNIDFSLFNIVVSIGQPLAILLRESNDNPNTVFGWAGTNSDVYAGGMRTYDTGSGFENTNTDFGFRTFVSVALPEPGSLALLGIGLFTIGLSGRRQKI